MKKLLNMLGSLTLIAAASTNVIACGGDKEKPISPIPSLNKKIENLNIKVPYSQFYNFIFSSLSKTTGIFRDINDNAYFFDATKISDQNKGLTNLEKRYMILIVFPIQQEYL